MTPSHLALADKTALVTGASSGLGAHSAEVLAAAGAKLILAARRTTQLAAVSARIRDAEILLLDVADAAGIATAAGVVSDVDILVNNAGLVRQRPAPSHSDDDRDLVIDNKLKGMFLIMARSADGVLTAPDTA